MQEDAEQLSRTLGFFECLTIGVGTMVGAGIFVFPGLAGAKTGTAATLSFLLGGFVATLVAFSTAELATAMPKSGGPYFFISRGLGAISGTVVGLGQWFGLVFASAFYLYGFGSYTLRMAEAIGTPIPLSGTTLAVGLGMLLILVNIAGTKGAGNIQNYVVAILLSILLVFLLSGFYKIFIGGDVDGTASGFAPEGNMTIFTTAAFVFTSYLGFAQIATVSGEVKSPDTNLPYSIIGSVLIVTFLYMVTVHLTTTVFPSDQLEVLGETALVEVGHHFLGDVGTVLILLGGLLATVSSANASILSSSRALYALSDDGVVPEQFARVSKRFETPHYALVTTGLLILIVVLAGRLALLAEVASFLHLLIYSLLCLTVIRLRMKKVEWYTPGYEAPGYPILNVLGIAGPVGVILFMAHSSILVGGVIIATSLMYYAIRRKSIQISDKHHE